MELVSMKIWRYSSINPSRTTNIISFLKWEASPSYINKVWIPTLALYTKKMFLDKLLYLDINDPSWYWMNCISILEIWHQQKRDTSASDDASNHDLTNITIVSSNHSLLAIKKHQLLVMRLSQVMDQVIFDKMTWSQMINMGIKFPKIPSKKMKFRMETPHAINRTVGFGIKPALSIFPSHLEGHEEFLGISLILISL